MHFTIVSYTFPPSTDIGGRRWAKFSQHLVLKRHKVSVICARQSVRPDWYQEEFPGVDVHLLPKLYPSWLTGNTKSVAEKIFYHISVRFLSRFARRNVFDRGFLWKKVMLRALEKVHGRKPIDVLVVTGAPFSLLYYGSLFKRRYNDVCFVTDLRDPWTWGSYYGIPYLSGAKKKYQEFSESEALEFSDLICYSTASIGEALRKKYPGISDKLSLLPHAYEPDKFPEKNKSVKRKGFIYGGTLYDGMEAYIRKLGEIVERNPNSGFFWDVYSKTHYPLINENFANGSVRKHGFIPEAQLFQKMQESAAYLVFFPKTDKDLISTKFFEIIYSGTPILYIGEEGEVGRFVRDNRVGVHVLPENMEEELPKFLDGNVPHEPGYFDITKYEYSAVTDSFIGTVTALRLKSEVLKL